MDDKKFLPDEQKIKHLERLTRVIEIFLAIILLLKVLSEAFHLASDSEFIKKILSKETFSQLRAAEDAVFPYARVAWEMFGVLLFVAVLYLLFVLRKKISFVKNFEDYASSYNECEIFLHKLARQNACCAVDIVKTLFVDVPRGRLSEVEMFARKAAVKECSRIVKSNLVDILDATSDAFEALTGERCAVCIQVLDVGEDASIDSANVVTVARDSSSAKNRSKKPSINKVSDNSLSRRIYIDGEDIVLVNNVLAALACGEMITTSSDAGRAYNAIFVVPIPYIGDSFGEAVSALCIDNMRGFRADRLEICTYFANLLAWRTAAMLYTISALDEEYENIVRLEQAT